MIEWESVFAQLTRDITAEREAGTLKESDMTAEYLRERLIAKVKLLLDKENNA